MAAKQSSPDHNRAAAGAPIYLDYNATTPVDERVFAKMAPFFTTVFGNAASSSHAFGWDAQEAVAEAREQAASLINAGPREIVFTSGATESINLALKGAAERYRDRGNHLVVSSIEHRAVLDTCRKLESQGFETTFLPVDQDGNLDLERLERSMTARTILVAVMTAQNEVGTIYPMAAIGEIARRHGALFFADAAQAVGKIPMDVRRERLDLAAVSAHKLYGPKGVGALFVADRQPPIELAAQQHGGGQERGLRSGTLNVSGIVGFGEACRIAREVMQDEMFRLARLRDKLERGIITGLAGVSVNGNRAARLPHVSNLAFAQIESKDLLPAIYPVAASAHAACASDSTEPGYVLQAMGRAEAARSSLRFSLGRFTTEAEIDAAIAIVIAAVTRLRR